MKLEVSNEFSNMIIWLTAIVAGAAIFISLIFCMSSDNQNTKQKIADAKTCEQAIILKGGTEMGVALKLASCATSQTKTINPGP